MEKTPIDKYEALQIAQKRCSTPIESFEIYELKPENWNIYVAPAVSGECWYIQAPGKGVGLQSSRAIVISKEDGEVIYDGLANDEG